MRTLLLLAAAANAFTTKQNSLPSARRTASTVAPKMLDAATIQGGAAAFGGLAVGVFSVWFSEQQITRGEERGSDAVSDFTKAKMSAMFMEDEVVPDASLDDTVRRMEAAIAAAKGEEVPVEEEPREVEVKDDGW